MKKATIIFLSIVLASVSCFAAASETSDSRHIETSLMSPFLTLTINADVVEPEKGTSQPVFLSDYATADDAAWRSFFFGASGISTTNVWEGLTAKELEKKGIYYPELEHFLRSDEISTRYNAYEALLVARYRKVEVANYWQNAVLNGQANGLKLTSEDAYRIGQDWVNGFAESVGWDGYQFTGCYAMPAKIKGWETENTRENGFYILEYSHRLENLPIAHDEYFPDDSALSPFLSDYLRIWVDDIGIFKVEGAYRFYTQAGIEPLNISVDDALEILEENMDYTQFFGEDNHFEITQIELCYRLVQTLPTYDKNVNARLEARPAWRFASKLLRQGSSDGFVMYVDAITGEVLP